MGIKPRRQPFLCVPDDDRSFDFIVGMLYTSLFQVLIECARKMVVRYRFQ